MRKSIHTRQCPRLQLRCGCLTVKPKLRLLTDEITHRILSSRFEALFLLQAKDTILGPSGLSYLDIFSGLNWNFLLDDSAKWKNGSWRDPGVGALPLLAPGPVRGLPLAAGAGAVEGLCPGLGRDPGVFFWEAAL